LGSKGNPTEGLVRRFDFGEKMKGGRAGGGLKWFFRYDANIDAQIANQMDL